jgi:hypothetical protein
MAARAEDGVPSLSLSPSGLVEAATVEDGEAQLDALHM